MKNHKLQLKRRRAEELRKSLRSARTARSTVGLQSRVSDHSTQNVNTSEAAAPRRFFNKTTVQQLGRLSQRFQGFDLLEIAGHEPVQAVSPALKQDSAEAETAKDKNVIEELSELGLEAVAKPKDKTEAVEPAVQSKPVGSDQKPNAVVYDKYMEMLTGQETIIEIDETTKLDKLRDFNRQAYSVVKKVFSITRNTILPKIKFFVQKTAPQILPTAKVLVQQFGRKRSMAVGGVVLVLVLMSPILLLKNRSKSAGDGKEPVDAQVQGIADKANAVPKEKFDPLLPESGVGGEVAFDSQRGLATFEDQISGHRLTVSQQKLTDKQKGDPQKSLEEIATAVRTQGSFQSKKGTVHYTLPDKVGMPQTAIFTDKGILVFIRTTGDKISPELLEEYVNSF